MVFDNIIQVVIAVVLHADFCVLQGAGQDLELTCKASISRRIIVDARCSSAASLKCPLYSIHQGMGSRYIHAVPYPLSALKVVKATETQSCCYRAFL